MIEIRNVSKYFWPKQTDTLKALFTSLTKRETGHDTNHRNVVLKDISFTIQSGEIFVVMGPNGSGKSTLAKILSHVMYPDFGRVSVTEKVVPFLELGVGFNSELDAKSNVILNGVILGKSIQYMKDNLEKIFSFAELHGHEDKALKFYSSGMRARLAFSIGLHIDGDIFIFDEILAVGDENFQKKCFEKFHQLIERKKTIIIVTHNADIAIKYGTAGLLVNKGKSQHFTDMQLLAAAYHHACL